ncbi:type IX secretion system ring subunit PorN/GldN [Brumimicrobium aurantiacum]|uniref:Gliding motility protein GldN n=1 Tax=Brumimicrobium aurantiacum TaxID=1737063 RepID=A0A3E1EV88_9FLAO|nr:gliding motility protein GldN [Brumimicrobium aurantiacum]RFC53432.1 gliding motility protein GldN [Brumimicrobium aurantiacum]
MKNLLLCTILIFSMSSIAQVNGGPINSRTETGVIDGAYLKSNIPTKRLIPYPYIREADAIWSKRVWRAIDLREKINRPLYFPLDEITPPDVLTGESQWVRNDNRWSLWTIIRQHILSGDLTLYSNYNLVRFSIEDGDKFKYPILPSTPGGTYENDPKYRDEINNYLATLGPQPIDALLNVYGEDSVDVNGNLVYPEREVNWFTSKDIIQYRLKEDWIFDKQRSVMDVRILGLAPVKYNVDQSNGSINGTEIMFWLYFPTDCRYVFNNYFVYNEQNGSRWMSFDDYFMKRRFSSYIYKEENVYDRSIEKYRVGVDALMESQRITEEIRNIEHDVWSY